ncbi:TMV resistance protein N-like protein [Tanacetum coccineum]
MASTSSSSRNMALPKANGSKYDVFLSFRGEDTRHSFTDHLYNALKQAGILTFRDSDDAERGEELKEEIEKAIKASDASIIVLSGNYATSTWCLDELSLILDQRRDCNHFVLPVFYHVDPSNVGKQKGSFEILADPSKRRWTDDNVKQWKAALTEVVSVIGMTLVGSEAKFIKEIVDTIYNRLDRKQIHIPANITGMDEVAKSNNWPSYIVDSDGQTVLKARVIVEINRVNTATERINTVCKGTAHIETLMERTKALIVLDEIVEEQHLEELLGSGNINKESKIIITTNNDISNWFMSKSKRFQKYIMRSLNDDEALELLSLHAFRSKLPKDGYTELAQQVVRYCGGNPLALEVSGSSLSKNDTITSWESELRSFEKSFHDDRNNKLMMHRLLQEMGRSLVDRESCITSERTRVWRNKDSYDILRRNKISNTIEGLALDIQTLMKEDGFESRHLNELSTDSLQRMDKLKLLQLKFVKLTGSYEDLSEDLRWLCWVGFNETTVRTHIYMRNMVALDMSYSYLKEFEPPMYLPSLKILNLKDSHKLSEIRNFDEIPNLETLILWNCHNLLHVCRTIGNLERLALLNMAGCKNLFNRVPIITSGLESAQELSFPLPRSLQRVFLNDCNLECTDYFPLSFSYQSFLQYINLANGHFEILPSYNLLKNLRVLDLRKCSRLKRLLCLPSTLAELYIYDCKSLEKITFESGRFTLQEFGYEGCIILSEIQGLVRLYLIAELNETDLGHMIWLKEYQHHEVCLVGDHQLTNGRCCHLQMLYEFNIMSTSLPDMKHPKLTLDYMSRSTSLSFEVPSCPRSSSRLIGLNVTFRYTISGDDWVWFAKIRTTNGVDLRYSPKVFGKPASGEVGIWLSYWPIGSSLQVRNEVTVSIVVMSGLEVHECGASLVYTDDDVARDILKNKMGWIETFGRDMSAFQLSKGCYYLCQRDFYKLMEVGRLSPGWLSNIVGDTIDDTEVRGWRMTGRPQQLYQSFSELKTVGCIGPEMVNILCAISFWYKYVTRLHPSYAVFYNW